MSCYWAYTNSLLKISITSFKDPVLKAKYSVIPLYFPLRKVALEIGPLIRVTNYFFFSTLSPTSKDFLIYSFFLLMTISLFKRDIYNIYLIFA